MIISTVFRVLDNKPSPTPILVYCVTLSKKHKYDTWIKLRVCFSKSKSKKILFIVGTL